MLPVVGLTPSAITTTEQQRLRLLLLLGAVKSNKEKASKVYCHLDACGSGEVKSGTRICFYFDDIVGEIARVRMSSLRKIQNKGVYIYVLNVCECVRINIRQSVAVDGKGIPIFVFRVSSHPNLYPVIQEDSKMADIPPPTLGKIC